jgi:hypothetical protein
MEDGHDKLKKLQLDERGIKILVPAKNRNEGATLLQDTHRTDQGSQ